MGLTRKEIKHDEFLETATEARHWLEENWKLAAAVLGGVLLVLVGVTGWRQVSASRDVKAQEALAEAQATYLRVDDPFAEDAPSLDDALTGFREVASNWGGRPAGRVARFYEGVVLLRMDRGEEAVEPLRAAAERAEQSLLRQNARVTLARALAAGGDLDGAAGLLREVADESDSPFPPEEALAVLAGLYADAGDAAASRDTLQEIVERFPDTPAARRANETLERLDQ